ncbi:MAG: arabinan endo-1,5-alpha-L-arabinosidase [Sphingomicrobium sp.]
MAGDLTPVHDPAIILAGKTFYLFTTSQVSDGRGLIHIRRSTDLVNWTRSGAVFAAIPAWAKARIAGTKGIWAPDIVKHGNEYRVYYSVSTFGSNVSAIGMATSPTLDPAAPNYRWTDQGMVVSSNVRSDYNAIDPNVVTDRSGRMWLSFGSFWTGIKMLELNPATGKPMTADSKLIAIASRATPGAIEAPFIVPRGEYYYLFASFDSCCRGAASTYYTVVGRSKEVTGPYLDAKGRKMLNGAGEVVLHAKLDPSKRWAGPGHPAVLMQGDKAIIVYHAYDVKNAGRPTLRIQSLGWDKNGWPVAL